MQNSASIARISFLCLLLLATAAFADKFRIAPHLQNVTPDGATLIWETEDETTGVVEYGPAGNLGNKAAENAATKIHRVRLTGLTADTAYAYRVKAGAEERADTFKTAPTAERAIVFTVVGDSRRWDHEWENRKFSDHMMQWNPEFCVNNGDLVLEGHNYDLWPEHFARFAGFNGKIMMASVRGNHEGARTADTEKDWYAKYHELSGAGEPFSVFDWGNTHFVFISMDAVGAAVEQLDQDLTKTSKKYTVVVFHTPVYCTGYMSPEDSRKETGKDLEPVWRVLDKHNVILHLAGHTHIYERTYPLRENRRNDLQGTTYVIQGGDINANYPDWWSAVTDDPATLSKPTYTLIRCGDDRVELRTFAWSEAEKKIAEIDRAILCRGDAVPAKLMADLPGLKGDARLQAVADLGATMYAPAAKALLPCLNESDATLRETAARALRSVGSADVAEALVPFLTDSDPIVAREVARSLEIAMPESLAKAVAKAIRNASMDEKARVSLVGALQFHAPPDVLRDAATDLLKGDAPAKVRNRAACALSDLAEKKDVKTLVKLFEKESERYAALRLAHAINKLSDKHVSITEKTPLPPPGQRTDLVKPWLK